MLNALKPHFHRVRLTWTIIAAAMIILIAGGIAFSTTLSSDTSATGDGAQPVKVAFIGDQGYGSSARAVLRLIKDEGADIVVHSGDFDYGDSPTGWDDQINQVLGLDFPYIAAIGNHDEAMWDFYQQKLKDRLARTRSSEFDCSGDLGVQSTCTFHGILFILSGVGIKGTGHEKYIKEQLQQATGNWRICDWHMTQRLMQVGDLHPDSVGWSVYEECRLGGAIVVTAHGHTYSRTYLLDSFFPPVIASKSSTLAIEKGKTFNFSSGIGGDTIRGQDDDLAANPWWASVYTTTQGATFGALFCTFNAGGRSDRAECYFKDISGRVIDSFRLTSNLASEAAQPANTTRP